MKPKLVHALVFGVPTTGGLVVAVYEDLDEARAVRRSADDEHLCRDCGAYHYIQDVELYGAENPAAENA